MKMNAKYKKAWIKALKSGEYKQGKERMYNESTDRYCCLGVLCDLTRKVDRNFKNKSTASLDTKNLARFKISNQDERMLIDFNDGIPMSSGKLKGAHRFEWIARWIDNNL